MSFEGDPLGFYGKLIVEAYDALVLEGLKSSLPDSESATPDLSISDDTLANLLNKKVGILGAGIGGLYAALLLDSIGVDYEILEASGRVGGRLETYRFSKGGEYDYYDAGAMRYPLPKKDENGKYKNGIMARLADLIVYEPLNQGSDKLKDKLIPYYYKARDEQPGDKPGFYYFNGVRQSVAGPKVLPHPKDPSDFRARDMGVRKAYAKAGYDAIQADALGPFVSGLIKDLETGGNEGWTNMLKHDAYSVRGYLATKYIPSDSIDLPKRHLPINVVNWMNLIKTGTSRYDRALTEAVFSEMEFANIGNTNYADVDWVCFEGGSETLSKKIGAYLRSKKPDFVKFGQRVSAIREVHTRYTIPSSYEKREIPSSARRTVLDSGVVDIDIGEDDSAKKAIKRRTLLVSTITDSGTRDHEYGHIISTLPLPVLRTIDLNNAGLNIMQKNALRALDYGFSVKIAVRFKSAWWTEKLGITGGQSFTDLPVRTIVYPSYGVDSATPSKVLIASYSWSSDASRLAALALKENREALKELVLRNLEQAHYGANGSKDITYDFLLKDLADGDNFHVKDWNSDEYTMGAFANFSPGEFGDLYTSLTVPASGGRLHFAGEAVSTRHRWVVGALDSAWRAVQEYLRLTKQTQKLEELQRIWKGNSEWTTQSTLVEEDSEHDLIDEHIALILQALLIGVV